MYPRLLNRRAILVATISSLTVTLLTYECLYLLRGIPVNTLIKTEPTTCDVWPNPSTPWLDSQLYEECGAATRTAHIGDSSILGNPHKCLRASPRLDRYHSSIGLDWSEVKWGELQSRCDSETVGLSLSRRTIHQQWRSPPDSDGRNYTTRNEEKVAIVLRTWDNYEYTDNRLTWLRALIAEASLQRDDKYRVFLLVNVKDSKTRLEEDAFVYDETMRKCVPSEFRDMALLFNERTLKKWYPKVQEHQAQNQMYQALQIFSHKFPEFDYIWQLEMDLRFTGHVHDMLQLATAFAREQHRYNLWERNGRFYIPALHNNSYQNFTRTVDDEIGDNGVWGPVSIPDLESQGPQPPQRYQRDWGIGEEADLINFMPMIDAIGTGWVYESVIHGFVNKQATPRRLSVVSIARTSRRLLQLVSKAQQQHGRWLVSEATMETFALLHGFKAVTVPHLITFNHPMTAEELHANINRGPPSNKAGGPLPSVLYTNKGWIDGPWWDGSYWFTGTGAQNVWNSYVRGEALPPMLLHPVKET